MMNNKDAQYKILEQHVFDKNYELSFEEFKEYMNINGLEFEYRVIGSWLDIHSVSSQCKMLHLPKSTMHSSCMFNGTPSEDTEIIFNKEIVNIRGFVPIKVTKEIKIKSIYFQGYDISNRAPLFDGDGLNHLDIAESNLPSVHTIKNLYTCCVIHRLIPNSIADTIVNSFIGCKLIDVELNVNMLVYESFNGIYDSSVTLTLNGEDTDGIGSSFTHCTNSTINIIGKHGECEIRDSFNSTKDTKVDVSNLIVLNRIQDSFCKSTLSFKDNTIDLSKTSISLIRESFTDSIGIDKICVPTSFKMMRRLRDKIKIVYAGKGKEINTKFIHCNKVIDIDYATDTIQKINIDGAKVSKLPSSLQVISMLDVYLDEEKEFNTAQFSSLKRIEQLAENNTSVTRVIIPNAVEISESAFDGFSLLRNIVLGDSIECIEEGAFDSICPDRFVIQLWVVKDSKTEALLKDNISRTKTNKISNTLDIIYVNSVDEAIAKSRVPSISKSTLSKAKLIYNNLDDPRITNQLNCSETGDAGDANIASFMFIYKLTLLMKSAENIEDCNDAKWLSQFKVKTNIKNKARTKYSVKVDIDFIAEMKRVASYAINGNNLKLNRKLYDSYRKLINDYMDIKPEFEVPAFDSNYTIIGGYDAKNMVLCTQSYIILIEDGWFTGTLPIREVMHRSLIGLEDMEEYAVYSMEDVLNEHDLMIVTGDKLYLNIGNTMLNYGYVDKRIAESLKVNLFQYIVVHENKRVGSILYNIFSGKYYIGQFLNSRNPFLDNEDCLISIYKHISSIQEGLDYIRSWGSE